MKKLAGIIILIIFLSGCNVIERKTATLWTNIPEMAVYVELFNATQKEYRIELIYQENPAHNYKLFSSIGPDIVVSENLNSRKIITSFSSLKSLVGKGNLDSTIFYQDLYKLGFFENELRVLPVSFNIPAIIFNSDTEITENDSITFTPEMLQKEDLDFNEKYSKDKRVMGFSASWEPGFLIDLAFLYNANFSETTEGDLFWEEDRLLESIKYCKELTKLNSGYDEENDFTLTYCYDPGYKLLNSGRIGFYYTTLRDFYRIPASDRSTLNLKWFGSNTSIPVRDDIIFAGIPSKSKKQKAAKAFLIWFLNVDNQKKIMDSAKFKRLQGFGICDGLSSLIEVNELVAPGYYRNLVGNVPPASFLSFPDSLPIDWKPMRDDVIVPWMKDQLLKESQNLKLSEVLKTWAMQQQEK